ncbi:MAG TPA: creatininase family protein [Gemmatimonadaceae bacterium]|nr:creatininase family protein [Gemmatimonadaceae bacterium]
MPTRPFILSETTWKTVDPTHYELAILPWGATEAHNYHLPYATDTILSERIAAAAAQRAWSAGARVLVLPAVPFGVQTTQLEIKGCINLNPSTQAALLADLAGALEHQGILKLCIVNGHGANDFRQIIRELQPKTKVFLTTVNWYKIVDPKGHFEDLGDHAGEVETSAMMHLAPEMVLPLSEAGEGKERRFRIAALREGWAWAPRDWKRITSDTGVGNPKQSSAEKGQNYLEVVVERLSQYFIELAKVDLGKLYE